MQIDKFITAGRQGLGMARQHGRPTFAWLWKRRAGVAITLLVLYILLPKCDSTPKTVVVPVEIPVGTAGPATHPSSQPAVQANDQYAGDLPLYNRQVQGSDPRWSMPAELSGPQLLAMRDDVDRLSRTLGEMLTYQRQYDELSGPLFDGQMLERYWTALHGRGFRDKKLPFEWSAAARERHDLVAQVGVSISLIFENTVVTLIAARLTIVEIDVVGGQVLVGDQLFMKGFDAYVTERHARFKMLLDQASDLTRRSAAEFGITPDAQGK